MKNILTKTLFTLCVAALLISFADLVCPNGEGDVYDGIVRLHILANSDSESDQQVKLLVRDAIIERAGEIDSECDIATLSDLMTDVANGVLTQNGFDYEATAVYGYETYPTREYDGVSFPAGRYRSLRIMLGQSKGQNWWCVLFPPLCLSAATADAGLSDIGIDTNSRKVYTSKKYVIRFKLLEWLR